MQFSPQGGVSDKLAYSSEVPFSALFFQVEKVTNLLTVGSFLTVPYSPQGGGGKKTGLLTVGGFLTVHLSPQGGISNELAFLFFFSLPILCLLFYVRSNLKNICSILFSSFFVRCSFSNSVTWFSCL